MKLAVISWLMNRRPLASILKYLIREHEVDYLLLLGNTLSPTLIRDVASTGVRVLGVSGNLDDPSVISAFKELNGFIEGKIATVNDVKVFGVGANVRLALDRLEDVDRVDILATFYSGYTYKCGSCMGSSLVDRIIDKLKPKLIITSICDKPCMKDNIVCPGYGYNGYLVLIKHFFNNYVVEHINLYNYLFKTYP